MSNETGGPAFPVSATVLPNGETEPTYWGMNLLDYFAGQALAGMLSNSESKFTNRFSGYAACAYDLAAAMLAERNRRMQE